MKWLALILLLYLVIGLAMWLHMLADPDVRSDWRAVPFFDAIALLCFTLCCWPLLLISIPGENDGD